MSEIYGYLLAKDRDVGERMKCFKEMKIDENNIFRDRISPSGVPTKRKHFGSLLEKVGEKDVIYVTSLSDFGKDYDVAIRDWNYIVKEIGADIAVLDMPLIDTRWRKEVVGTYVTDVVTAFFDYMGSDKKRRMKLQSIGINEARKEGRRFGRPANRLPENFERVAKLCIDGELHQTDAADMLGMSYSTFRYNMLKMKNAMS